MKHLRIFHRSPCLLLVFALTLVVSGWADSTVEQGPERAVDACDKLQGWEVIKPADTALSLSITQGMDGKALCLNYDLGKNKLYVVARKRISLPLPANYEFSFYIKGVSPRNNLEFKLSDEQGNTFLRTWKNCRISDDWRKLVIRRKDLRYGWGPNAGAKLKEVAYVEFAIASGQGGKGEILIDGIAIRELPVPPPRPPMNARASSEQAAEHAAQKSVDDNFATKWRSASLDKEWLEIDLGEVTSIAGLSLHWADYGNYDVLVSTNGKTWQQVYSQNNADGGLDDIYFKETKARFVRIAGKKLAKRDGYQLVEVEVKRPDEAVLVTASSERKNNDESAMDGDREFAVPRLRGAGSRAENAMDGDLNTLWHSKGTGEEWLQLDLRSQKSYGGLFIHWGEDYPRSYEVDISDDGDTWTSVYVATNAPGVRGRVSGVAGRGDANLLGRTDKVFLEETESRFLRIACKESETGNGYAIRNIELKSPDEEMTVTRFYQIAAEKHPGCYPRWLSNEQAYWTIVGTADDDKEGLICEDGTIEPHKRGFTIMPLLSIDGRLITRNNAEVTQSLEKQYLPIPTVRWSYGNVRMDVQLFAHGGKESSIYACYTIKNLGKTNVEGKLFLVIHPMQVYPPWQGGTDGFSPINSIDYSNGVVELDQERDIFLLTNPENFAAKTGTFQIGQPVDGDIVDDVAHGKLPVCTKAEDAKGFASGVAVYKFKLAPGESRDVFVAVPLHKAAPAMNPGMSHSVVKAQYDKMLRETEDYWESRVNLVDINIPDEALVNVLKANIAYNLITKDGPGFQPGSRSYDKAWMRDGGVAAIALMKVGLTNEIREFLDWMAGYQFESGEVAPIIDNKHEDPLWEEKQGLHEFDSQGQFVHVILQYYYFTKDRPFLEKMYPKVVKALEFLAKLREKRATPEFRDNPEKRIFYNILPPSRSHEGYWLAHSYWDDFWALAGWKDGKTIAEILGKQDQAKWMEEEYQALKKGVYDTINLVMKVNNVEHIPGCAEKGDFDATSTAAAIVFCDELENMPQPQLKKTFDRFFNDLTNRFEPGAEFVFTPYEIRTVLAYLFMGQKARALKLLNFMTDCCRPRDWCHLAEVVHSGYRFPCYIGDMPHTWVGAGYINSARGLFVYEKHGSLVLGAGIDPAWLNGTNSISIGDFPTWFGHVSYQMEKRGNAVKVRVWGDADPPDGFILKSPLDKPVREVTLNGEAVKDAQGNEARFNKLPAEITFSY